MVARSETHLIQEKRHLVQVRGRVSFANIVVDVVNVAAVVEVHRLERTVKNMLAHPRVQILLTDWHVSMMRRDHREVELVAMRAMDVVSLSVVAGWTRRLNDNLGLATPTIPVLLCHLRFGLLLRLWSWYRSGSSSAPARPTPFALVFAVFRLACGSAWFATARRVFELRLVFAVGRNCPLRYLDVVVSTMVVARVRVHQ